MSEGTLIKPECIPQEAWYQSGPAACACLLMLVRRLEEIERRPGMNSGNSSLPPSNDRPGQQPVSTAKPKSRRKRGCQAGHVKWTRSLIPTEACDQVVHHRPGACSDCGAKLSGDDPNPKRHQITDLPPVTPIVTEHQIHTLQCPDCEHRCRRQLPATLPRGCFGSGVVAVVTLLSSFGRLSQRMISGILQDLYQLKVADGQTSRRQSVVGKLAILFAVRPRVPVTRFINCWAHLLRDFQAMIDRGGVSAEIGTRLKESGQELIHNWNRLKSKNIQRATFDHYNHKLRGEILEAIHDGALCGEPKTAESCRRLGNECYSLFVLSVTALARGHALRGVGLRNCCWNSSQALEAFRRLRLSTAGGPAHAGSFEAAFDKGATGAFNHARCNRKAGCQIFVILHAICVRREIAARCIYVGAILF
jgi:hypothetical protein